MALLGMVLVLPSLPVGWQLDDYVHRVILSRAPAFADLSSSPLDMFNFLDGDPDRTRRIVDLGLVPWWMLEDARVAFWRPMSALTHWVDYRLWPQHPGLMHLQSMVWYGLLCAAAAVLYRQIMGAGLVAGLAAFLYAVDPSHGFPVGWLANRNAVLGMMFAVLAIACHDRWRRSGWSLGVYAGPSCLGLALLSAEASVATVGYLVAYAVVLDRDTRVRRMLSLLPYGVAVLSWQLIYQRLGYGTWGASPFYVNPVLETGRFAEAVVERGSTLLFAQWALPSFGAHGSIAGTSTGTTRVIQVLFFALLVVALLRVLRTSDHARFWALGQLLAVIPACATLPHSRQLFFLGLGASGLLAEFLVDLADQIRQGAHGWSWRIPLVALGVFLLIVHGVLAPFKLASTASEPVAFDAMLEGFASGFPTDPMITKQDLVIVNAPDAYVANMLHFHKLAKEEPVPLRTRRLASAASSVQISRPDRHTLVIRPDGGYYPHPIERGFRGEAFPMTRGQQIALTGLTVEVTEVTPDGRPAEVAFRFAVPLDDPSLRWLEWQWHGSSGQYAPFVPPPIGKTRQLPSQ